MDRSRLNTLMIVYRLVWVFVGTILTCIVIPLRYLLYYDNAFEKHKPLWRDKE